MHLKKLLLPLFTIFGMATAFSQSKMVKEADVLFYTKRYSEAYHLYEKAYEKEKKKDAMILLKMAECNYMTGNYPVAQGYYEQYFTDTLYHAIPEYTNYANATRLTGKIELAVKLYNRINQNGGDADTKQVSEVFKLYLDSAGKTRVYDLDSVYTCIALDATESLDSAAAPMVYVWGFKDGTSAEGISINHCFKTAGLNEVTLNIRDKATGYVKLNDTTLSVFIESPKVKFTSPKKTRQYFYTTFDASTLAIDGYDIVEYIWDLGGERRLGKKVQMKFDKLDFYVTRLTVVAKSKSSGAMTLFASSRAMEVVDNYSDHSIKFQDNLNEKR